MRLLFSGPPGAGKGTQADLLKQRHQVATFSSGALLREAVRREDPLGSQVADFMKRGALVPDNLVTDLILEHLRSISTDQSFVLDGFPRNLSQARALDEVLVSAGQSPIDLMVDFDMSTEKVVERLAGRRICSHCSANYHLKTQPPQKEGICDQCGEALQARVDDAPETILKRMDIYRKEAAPLLSYYEAQGKLRKVSGDLKIEVQYEALAQLLQNEKLLN